MWIGWRRLLAAEISHPASEPAPRPVTPPAGERHEPEKTAPGSSAGNTSQDKLQGQQAQPGVEVLAGLAGMNGLQGLASRRLARAKALKAAAVIYEINLQARSEHSQGMLAESIALCRGLGPAGRHELAVSLEHLGWTLADQERGPATLKESLEIFRDEQDLFYIAESLHHLANMVAGQGDHQQARAYLEESLALRRRIDDWDGMGFCLLFMGQLALYHGNYDRAADPDHRKPGVLPAGGKPGAPVQCLGHLLLAGPGPGKSCSGRRTRRRSAVHQPGDRFAPAMRLSL